MSKEYLELEDLWKINEYFDLIRDANECVGRAYFNVCIDLITEKSLFDKISMIKFIETLKETNVIDNRANDILLKFIKPM